MSCSSGAGRTPERNSRHRSAPIPSLAPLESLVFTYRLALPPDFPASPDPATPGLFQSVQGIRFDDSDGSNNFAFVPVVVTPVC